MPLNKVKLVLALCLLLAFFLRFYHLSTIPAGLHFDEAQSGYNGFLLWQHQKNLLGNTWPIHIDYFGDYRPALSSYLTAPFVGLNGLNTLNTRMPVALFGLLLIIVVYFFAKITLFSTKIALLAAFLVTISPYATIFSRGSADAVIETTLTLLGIIGLVTFFKHGQKRYLVLTYFFWLFSYFTYQNSRLLILILTPGVIFLSQLQFHSSRRRIFLSCLPLLLYLLFPFIFFLLSPLGQGRFKQVAIFSHPTVQLLLNEEIREDGVSVSPLTSRIFHNKFEGYSQMFLGNYLTYFSPVPILFSIVYPDYFSVPNVGPFTFWEFIGCLIGLALYLKSVKRPLAFLPLLTLLCAPIPAALTFDSTPNFLRSFFMLPPFLLISSLGLIYLLKQKSFLTKSILTILILIALGQFASFLHHYLVHQPKHFTSIQSRRTEMPDLAAFLGKHSQEPIWLSDYEGPYLYYLFFNKLDVFNQKVVKPGRYFVQDFQINNLQFSKDTCPPADVFNSGKYRFIISRRGCRVPESSLPVEAFYSSDDSLVSVALTYSPLNRPIYPESYPLLDNLIKEKYPRIKI